MNDQIKIGLKALVIVALSLLFLIPLMMIGGISDDRKYQQLSAMESVSASWGGATRIGAPLLLIPYEYRTKNDKDVWFTAKGQFFIAPETSVFKIDVQTEMRQKGIFTLPIYRAAIEIEADFTKPDLVRAGLKPTRVLWDEAQLVLSMGQMNSYEQKPQAVWDGRDLDLTTTAHSPHIKGAYFISPIPLNLWKKESLSLKVSAQRKGSESLSVLPWAAESRVTMSSNWISPSFTGKALPDSRNITSEGFHASWTHNSYSSVVSQNDVESGNSWESFGVEFFQPLNVYQMTHRAIEYGILLIILPFVALFLLEIFTKSPVHPIQYALIGLANSVFYLLLLSLSEHWSFFPAYWTAAGAVTLLVTWYASQILKHKTHGLIILPILGGLYGFMNLALQSEDYALLIGSLGLFMIVALVMIITRKINWYGGAGTTKEPSA